MEKQVMKAYGIACIVICFVLLMPGTGSAFRTIAGNDIELTCGQQHVAGKRILIIYDTKYGATRTIANTIQDVLCAAGAQVDMSIVKRIQDVSPYDAIIVGSAIISEQWRPDLVKFLKDHEELLATKPVAVFIVCGLLKDDTPENREIAKKYYIDRVMQRIPMIVPIGNPGLFAGIMDYSVLTPLDEFLVRALFGRMLPEGDYRNFDKVTQWTEDIYALLR